MAESIKNYNHIDLLFPSEWLKAADFGGRTVTVVIDRIDPRVEIERKDRKKEKKPVIYLKGAWKPWLLNKTNGRRIAKLYGNEITGWIGRPLMLKMEIVDAFGDQVEAIRVVPQAPPPPKQRSEPKKETQGTEPAHDPETGEVAGDDIGPPPMTDQERADAEEAISQ
jgi:hypothetical protein